ncbi:hypothetical protein OGAPHI_004841 [Ogataea philodendri]|uniref:Uncharacterized protein n=1 Tax=Ogataea philodendri TaxID=1378263 RepID=A0A9P8P2S2_9ASCO|nr:uncharacterized protein OGAPHI_004841 [Ogataea philodendri]KAH3664127.1 hypothetical protein OGAPHI_004841 [Ogataea philodendri]
MVNLSRTLGSDRVRFSRDTKLSDYEKQRRSSAASDFLEGSSRASTAARSDKLDRYRPLSTSSSRARTGSPRSILRSSSRDRKSYELLGESPIRSIPNARRFETDDILSSIKKKRYPVLDTKSRVTKVSKPASARLHDGLLGSLTSIGSKLLQSVLYSESKDIAQPEPEPESVRVRSLERPLERSVSVEPVSYGIERNINDKFESLASMIRDLKTEEKDSVMDKLAEVKGELLNLRATQELINSRFEERYEELKIENELNKRKFEKLFTELESKRNELDKEKTEFIKLLQKENRKRYVEDSDEEEVYKKRKVVKESARDKIDKMRQRNKLMAHDISESISEAKKISSMI